MKDKKIITIILAVFALVLLLGIAFYNIPKAGSSQELSLVLSSIKHDLKIKLVDDKDTLVKGVHWVVNVADSVTGETKSYEDGDKDGIIHLSDLTPGEYSVSLQPSEDIKGKKFSTDGQKVNVKDKAEYKVVDRIMEEIKQESEVDTEAEDPNGNDAADKVSEEKTADTTEEKSTGVPEEKEIVDEHVGETGVLGIDVSKFQPTVNFESVKASGVDYVIIRCGYRGAKSGNLVQDPSFTSHISKAKAAGLKVGIYFFSTAMNEAEAIEEASMCAKLCSEYEIDYPIFIDVEESDRSGYNDLSPEDRTNNIKAFCSTISSAGYTSGLYAGKNWMTNKINTSTLSCKIWLAQYREDGPTYEGHYDIWQYTPNGKVDGIDVNVDMNHSYLGE